MFEKNTFYFVRHGKTDWNGKNLCQGQRDIPLNDAGRREVEQICPLISRLPISKIVTSPLLRAFESAKIIQQYTRFPLEIVDEIKERNWGEMEGASSSEMYAIEEKEENDKDFVPGLNIESRLQFKSRIIRGMNAILNDAAVPLIVSHGRVFLTLSEILGIPPIRQIPNAAVWECIPSHDGWSSRCIYDDK